MWVVFYFWLHYASLFGCQSLPLLLVRVQMVQQRRWQWLWAVQHLCCVRSNPTLQLSSPGSKMATNLSPVVTSESFQVWDQLHTNDKLNVIVKYGAVRYCACVSTGGRTLQILNTREGDAGRYTCVATNEAGETLKHYEVKVYGENLASCKDYVTLVYEKVKVLEKLTNLLQESVFQVL